MTDLSGKIQCALDDLDAIHRAITGADKASAIPDRGRIEELKLAVDNMRHVIWGYLSAVDVSEASLGERLQAVRMQRAAEMLRVLRPQMEQGVIPESPERHSLFNAIQAIANTAVEKHLLTLDLPPTPPPPPDRT